MMRRVAAAHDQSPEFPGGLVGVRFRPKDEELLYYLNRKVNREALNVDKGLIPEKAVYDVEPWLLGHPRRRDLKKDEWYCFVKLEKASSVGGGRGEGKRIRRSVAGKEGGGWWQGNTGDSEVVAERGGAVLGFKKTFTFFKNKKVETKVGEKRKRRPRKEEAGDKTDWIMHEYRLASDNTHFQEWVVCRIRYTGKNATAVDVPVVEPLGGQVFHDVEAKKDDKAVTSDTLFPEGREEGGNAVPIAVDEAFPGDRNGGGDATIQMTESSSSNFIITIDDGDQVTCDMLSKEYFVEAGDAAVPIVADDQAFPAAEFIPEEDFAHISNAEFQLMKDDPSNWLFGGGDTLEFQRMLNEISTLFSSGDDSQDGFGL